jgi:hypothetical protein
MLLKAPDFQKRIRETILRAAFVCPTAEEPDKGEGWETSPCSAVVQSVTFLGVNPEAKVELHDFRNNLAHYTYKEHPLELKELLGDVPEGATFPTVIWMPYVALPEDNAHPLDRDIKAGYSVLEGEPTDLCEYLKECNSLGLPAVLKTEKSKGEKAQYPISVLAVHIPWGNAEKTTMLPTPAELADLAAGLTTRGCQQVAVCISGPATAVEAYNRKFLNQPVTKTRKQATLASVEVKEGYITCDSEEDADNKLDRFLSFLKIDREAEKLEKASEFCRKGVRSYIQNRIEQESAEEELRELRMNSSGMDLSQNFELEQAEMDGKREVINALRDKAQEFETYFAEIRRSTLGIKGRDVALQQEREADSAVSKLIRATIRREKAIRANKPEKEYATAEALAETAETIAKDYMQCIDSLEALQKTILESPHGCAFGTWATQIVLIRSNFGFQGNHAGEAFTFKTDRWGDRELKKLFAHTKENRARETSLGWYGGYENITYPTAWMEPILNPGCFPKLPAGLLPTWDPLTPIEPPKVRLDIRLQPRADIWPEALLDLDNHLVEAYNPVAGKPMGFKDAALWRPVITRRGIPQTAEALKALGYELECSAQTHNFVERKVRKAEKILAPNYPLTPYEAMAYFENGPRPAEKTVVHPDTGETLWVEGKSYHITPSWRRQTMLVDHSVEDGEEPTPEAEAPAEPPALTEAQQTAGEDIVVVGNNENAQKIRGGTRISTLTERRINFGYSTFIVEAEGGKTYEIRETVTKDTIGMEKERIAIEIEHLSERLKALEARPSDELKKPDRAEMAKLRTGIEEKTRELDEWAPMLEDFLDAFPPEAPPLASEVYTEQIASASKAIFSRFGPYIKTEESGEESSIKDYQLKWAAVGAVKRGHLDGSNPGAGKAQPLDAKVLTGRGWIRMGDITLEDQVLTPDGKQADVLGIFPQGKVPIYKVTFEDGRSTEACGEHLWKVYEKGWSAGDKALPFPIEENKVGYRVINTKSIERLLKTTDRRLYIPLLDEVKFPTKELPLDPYLLGAILGDGGISGAAIAFTNTDEDVIAEIRKGLLPDYRLKKNNGDKYGYYLSHKAGIWQKNQKKGAKKIPSNPYKTALKGLGLMGKKSPEKWVPQIYKEASHNERIRLIQGLMDTDGSVDQNGGLQFYSTSKQLAEDMAELIWSVGGTAHVSPKQTYYTHNGERLKGRPSHVVHIRHNRPWDLVLCHRKSIRISKDYQYAGSVRNRIVSVEKIGEREAQCILIDHPEHLYLTDNYTVTHNTIMALMSSWRMGHHYNWIICPTIAMKTWAAELERVGLYHEMVGYKKDENGVYKASDGPYEHMRRLVKRFHDRVRTKNRLGKIEPEYYIVSAEAVCLGGEGNKTYSPWHADHYITGGKVEMMKEKLESGELTLPPHWEATSRNDRQAIRVWSDRQDTAKEISSHGWDEYLKPMRFSRAIKKCPKCEAEAPTWSKHGHCGACGHSHSAITRKPSGWDLKGRKGRLAIHKENLTAIPAENTAWEGSKTSLRQYPLYKMMGKHVGCKIIDEIHNWSNFHSQHGAALLQVRCKDAIVLSGTLCKTHIAELEPSLCQVYEPNSGEFPYAPWGMGLFKEQFQTVEMESTYRSTYGPDGERTRRRTTEKVVPEASNLTKLRALMHGVMCAVGETEMERVWNLRPINEAIRYVELQPTNAAIYAEWERLLQAAYEECKTEVERVGMLRRARSQMTHLAYACDGPEKLEAAISWIRERIAAGQRAVVVGPSTRFYTMLAKALREREIPFMAMGNTAPEKRYEILNKFRDSNCPIFLSRIRLVNVNFNQLTCCTHILFTGIDPSPAALRQMQKRLNRIGQTQDVHCTFLISQMPRRQAITQEIEQTLAAIETGEAEEEQEQEDSVFDRPPSYEERLFALVLRRETAIKQTLQQADRQRDPQELYEMLRDRQTLNQLLEDIITNAKTDASTAEQMKLMAEKVKPADITEAAPLDSNVVDVEAIAERTETAAESQEEIAERDTIVAQTRRGKKKVKATREPAKEYQRPEEPELEEAGERLTAPDGHHFTWAPVRKHRPEILQGELFAL